MVGTLSRITTLLLAAGILLIGHGLQLTLLPIRAEAAGWSASLIGLTGSLYFLGFVVGCVLVPGIVSGVGHIRSFMVMAAIATVAFLSAGLFVSPISWFLFRFATGFALSGLYMVIESWLNDVSPSSQRGTVLAIYTTISLVGMALGQFLMQLADVEGLKLFALGAILMVASIIPIGLTRVESPNPLPPIQFTPRILLKLSRVSVVCAALAGMVTSTFWTLGPVLGRAFGLEGGQVGTMMAVGIVGGALSQLPLGRLSDVTDRRTVIGAVAAAGVGVAVAGLLLADTSAVALYGAIFFLGAVSMPIYALCIVHASDSAELTLIEVASGILIAHSAGSILGPIVVATLMDAFGPQSFFAYVAVCLLLISCWASLRRIVVERGSPDLPRTALLPRTTQAIAELSPNWNSEPEPAEKEA
jgi:MFS family permease